MNGWYAVRTAPQREFVSQTILRRRGFMTFVPIETKLRRKTRYCKVRIPKDFPMVPGYLFVHDIDNQFRWRDLFSVHTIQSVVGFDGKPALIPDAKIQELAKLSVNSVLPNPHKFLKTRNEFAPGDTVAIWSGPFEGAKVRVQGIIGRKAQVLLDMFGGQRIVDIDVDMIEAL